MKAVCVFCGSSDGARPEYRQAAETLGRYLAEQGIELVYGGASVGLMGAVADAALAAGGRVVGVIPRHFIDREVAHAGLTELHVTASMHERKAMMADRVEAFIALPGGYGTLEELAEATTWTQLGLHRKPVGLLDVAGYFALLLQFVDHMIAERFLPESHRELLIAGADPAGLVAALDAWQPIVTTKQVPREDVR